MMIRGYQQLLALALCSIGTACIANGGTGDPDGSGQGASSQASGANAAAVSTGGSGGTPGGGGTVGTSETGGGTLDDPVATCATLGGVLQVGRTPLRRMTKTQFDNTVRDLLGVTSGPAAALAPDERIGPFPSNALTPITDLLVQQHHEIAERLATEATPQMDSIAGCPLAGDPSCVASFVAAFGRRAYRRPLSADEQAAYMALFATGTAAAALSSAEPVLLAQGGFSLVVETMLQSPFFLYHVDLGTAGLVSSTPVPLTAYELASRLSYFLWNTMPDEPLFALAESGALLDPATRTSEVQRMLSDGRAQETISSFHLFWLRIGDMSAVEKDSSLFPNYGPELAQAMVQEVGDFARHVIFDGDGTMATLLTSTISPMRGPLFPVYGMTEPVGFVPGTLVDLPATERSGLLTRAAFLATNAHPNQTSPVHRGLAVRENLLCQPLESPPEAVNTSPPTPSAATTTRERFANHVSVTSCANCHLYMDPIGLGFENYDPIGAYRTEDGASPVDASGELQFVEPDLAGSFSGALELSQKLSTSREVAACMANQWLRYALGRMESVDDACSVAQLHDGFEASGRNIRALLEQVVQSDAFRHVRHEAAEVAP